MSTAATPVTAVVTPPAHDPTPDVFDGPPAGVTNERAAYVIQRLRQTHDLWHVVTGYDTDPASEVALQAFTYAQLRAPGSLVLAALGFAPRSSATA